MIDGYDGYINSVTLTDGKKYLLQCQVVEVYPMICPKCGGNVTLKYGNGTCDYCGTSYTTQFKVVEK